VYPGPIEENLGRKHNIISVFRLKLDGLGLLGKRREGARSRQVLKASSATALPLRGSISAGRTKGYTPPKQTTNDDSNHDDHTKRYTHFC
jgi:hypothetical protein